MTLIRPNTGWIQLIIHLAIKISFLLNYESDAISSPDIDFVALFSF